MIGLVMIHAFVAPICLARLCAITQHTKMCDPFLKTIEPFVGAKAAMTGSD